MKFTAAIAAALLAQQSFAHPGESVEEHAKDIAERRAYLNANKRDLSHCAAKLKARGNDAVMNKRRAAHVEKLRAKRAIDAEQPYLRARDLSSVVATDHKSNLTGITADSDPSLLFTSNNSCILTPEVTQGPYWVKGELVRQDITEDESGVPLTLDIQIIDVNTCDPVPEAYLEMWHCNSTGVYSGVVASGNGNQNDSSNLNASFLRGIQQSDDDGVVQFNTVFPGHYDGRATHIHVMSSRNATLLSNNTISGGSVTHVGQMFFDQSLIALVSSVEPYASNTQAITENSSDMILSEEAGTVDPMVEYVLLGDSVADGIFGWLAFGMDSKSAYNATPAAYWTETGGVKNENADTGMGGGSPPSGTGGPPSGITSGAGSPFSTTLVTVSSAAANALAGTLSPQISASGAHSYAASSNGQQHGGGKGRPSGSLLPPSGRPSDRPSDFPSGAPQGRPYGAPGNDQQNNQQNQPKQTGGY